MIEILSDEAIDLLLPTEEEIQSFLDEPTPPDDLNQYLENTLTDEVKRQVAISVVHCRKVAQAQAEISFKAGMEWGDSKCPHHDERAEQRNYDIKSECPKCWQELKQEVSKWLNKNGRCEKI